MTLLVLAIAYILGVWLGSLLMEAGLLGCDLPGWLWIVPLALLPLTPLLKGTPPVDDAPLRWPESAGFVRPRKGIAHGLIVAVLLCLIAGGLRFASVPQAGCWTPVDLAAWNLPSELAFDKDSPQVTVVGYISNFPTTKDLRQEVVVTVSRLRQGDEWHTIEGQVRLITTPRTRYFYGQPVEVTGRLATAPDFAEFSYREVLARRGIHSHFYDARVDLLDGPMQGATWRRFLYGIRSQALALIGRMLPEPHAALAAGILLGVDAGIPDALYDRFNATGTSHVLVISGSNVALIAALLLGLSRRLVRRWATLVALVGIVLYAFLVGAEASVLRAALMGGLVVIAAGVNRRSTALISLAGACWVMLLVNPQTLYDVGFQLSAMATLGLTLFATRIMDWLSARWPGLQGGLLTGELKQDVSISSLLRGMIVDGGVMTVAASILTLPLVAYHFQRVSLLGVLVNLLIVPVQSVILVAGTLGVTAGLVGLPWLAQGLFWVAWLGLSWTTELVNWVAMLPGTSVDVTGYGVGALLATYALIAFAPIFAPIVASVVVKRGVPNLDLATLHPNRLTTPAGLGTLFVVAGLVWGAVFTLPDGRLHLYFLDIGQGDGILIQTPSGRQLLIDGGASRERLLTQLGEVMPWWDRSLDIVLATHPDRDHMGAQVIVPERFEIDYALESPAIQDDPDAEEWRMAFVNDGTAFTLSHVGGWVDLGDGVALWVLWPPPVPLGGDNASNENSLVTKLVYGDFSVLLTGDAGIPSESSWLATNAPLESDVLKVGHHGSAHSTSSGLVEAVNPEWAVIQVGATNSYGHPTQTVLDLLAGSKILRNDEDGRIHFSTDGTEVWVETER
jgi:competence protein ComEC